MKFCVSMSGISDRIELSHMKYMSMFQRNKLDMAAQLSVIGIFAAAISAFFSLVFQYGQLPYWTNRTHTHTHTHADRSAKLSNKIKNATFAF